MIEQDPIYAAAEKRMADAAQIELFSYRERRGAKPYWVADYCVRFSTVKKYAEVIAKKLGIDDVKSVFKELKGDLEYLEKLYVINDDAIFTDIAEDTQYTLVDIYKAFNGDDKDFAKYIKAFIEYAQKTKKYKRN